MDQTQKLLNEIIENARMGASSCEQLIKKTENPEMRRELQQEQQVYEGAIRDAEKMIYASGVKPGATPISQRMSAWMGMEINTMMDKSAAHIAEMTIQGATMGIISLTKARNAYADADPQAQGIAAALIEKQQEAIDRLKTHLTETVKSGS